MSDAIVRTLVRVYGTRRRLLEWVTAAQAKAGLRLDLSGLLPPDGRRRRARRRRGPRGGVGAAGGLAGRAALSRCCGSRRPRWRAGSACRGAGAPPQPLSPADAARAAADRAADVAVLRDLRRRRGPRPAARQLPGDAEPGRRAPHVADEHRPVSARRRWPRATSAGSAPSTPSSGWRRRSRRCGASSASAATSTTGTTRGDLRPLEPKYVSSVDSGNLAGHLIALAHAAEEMAAHPCRPRAALAGIGDAASLVRLASRTPTAGAGRAQPLTRAPRRGARRASRRRSRRRRRDPAEWRRAARRAAGPARRRCWTCAARCVDEDPERAPAEVLAWAEALVRDGREPRAGPRPARHARAPPRPSLAAERPGAGRRHGLRLPLRPDAQAVRDRLPRRRRHARLRAATTCSPRRRAWRASSRSPRATSRSSHWFRLGRALTPVGARLRARVLVGVDVRVPDAGARDAVAGREPARADRRLVVRRQITLRRRARRALGRLGVGLQRARPRDDLPVLELRRAGARAATRAQRGRRDRALRDGLAAMVDPAAAVRNFAAPGARPGPRRLRLLRGARLHRVPAAGGRRRSPWCAPTWRTTRAWLLVAIANALHDGAMRARFHAEPMVQATELLLQERTPRDVAVARPRADEVHGRRRRARVRAAGRAALHLAARRDAAHPPALERPLRGDADDGGLRLQPLARPRHHALAGGRHARRLGDVRVPSRRRQRRELVGRLPAAGRRAGQLRGRVLRGPGRDRAARRRRSRPRSR